MHTHGFCSVPIPFPLWVQCSWVQVWVWEKNPEGYPCHTLILGYLDHTQTRFQEMFVRQGEQILVMFAWLLMLLSVWINSGVFLCDLVKSGMIEIIYIQTQPGKNLVDIFTKGLPGPLHEDLTGVVSDQGGVLE